jgi:hypothetical protein
MTEVPKIVHDRLRAGLRLPGASERAHPDANLLTAFTEQALPAAERDSVLEHLALCGDCREVLALALPDSGVVAAPFVADTETTTATVTRTRVSALHGLRFGWSNLRWAAPVAAIAVVAAVLLIRPGKPPVSSQQVASSVPAQSMPSPAAQSPTGQFGISQQATPTHTDTADKKSDLTLSKKFRALKPVPSPQMDSGMLSADDKESVSHGSGRPAAPSAKFAYDAEPRQGVNKRAGIGGAAETVTVAPSNDDTLVARNDAPVMNGQTVDAAPVEKAKPAPPETEAAELKETLATPAAPSARLQTRSMSSTLVGTFGANAALATNSTWAIKAGVLQRSLDHGQSWQNALHADHPLLCYATHGMDVWAGGAAGTLFHSADGGTTWLQVQPSFEARQLSADVTHIDLPNNALPNDTQSYGVRRSQIAFSTSNNEVWSSMDGGKTWTKNTAEKK